MNKMLVAVFDDEQKAYEGLSAMKELHRNGDITLYSSAVISKDVNGELQIKEAADNNPSGTATGLLAGSLIGLVGGPIGLVIGASFGAITGFMFGAQGSELEREFHDEVIGALGKGKTAIIAEIDETWMVWLDTEMERVDGMVFRRLRYETAEEQLVRGSEAMATEYKMLKEEHKEAKEEDKAKIQKSIDRVMAKSKAVSDRIEAKIDALKKEGQAKVNAIKAQMQGASDRRKNNLKNLQGEVEKDYEQRAGKLEKVAALIRDAANA